MASTPLLSLVSFGHTDQFADNALGPKAEHEVASKWTFESDITVNYEDARQGNYWALLETYLEVGKARGKEAERRVLEMASKICDLTGQVVHRQGQTLDHDFLLDLEEKMPYRFDDEGNPIQDGQAFVIHADQVELLEAMPPPTPAQVARRQEMMERKLAEYRANERVRRLPRHSRK